MLDTNVIVAALRSSSGASHGILLAADREQFELVLSVPLLMEYDDVCARPETGIPIPPEAVDAVIGRLAALARKQTVYYLWRPLVRDPKDDMVLEAAVASGASHIVTFNHKDLSLAAMFGIAVVKPSEFIRLLP